MGLTCIFMKLVFDIAVDKVPIRGANPVSLLGEIIGQILLNFAISRVWGYDF